MREQRRIETHPLADGVFASSDKLKRETCLAGSSKGEECLHLHSLCFPPPPRPLFPLYLQKAPLHLFFFGHRCDSVPSVYLPNTKLFFSPRRVSFEVSGEIFARRFTF